jgi:outer membrane lipoprotein SlyB
MKKIGIVLAAWAAMACVSYPVQAQGVNGDAVIGGALGGAAGAAIGSAVGGRDGAIIGGAVGGATGTALMTSGRREPSVRREVVYVDDHDHRDNGLHRGHYKQKHRHRHERYQD